MSASQPIRRRRLLGLAAAAPLAVLAGCTGRGELKSPQVALADVRPVGGGLFAQQLRLDLRVTNPNDVALEVDGLRADLSVNGQPFAQGVSDARVTVPRLGSADLPVEATVSTFDLARQIFNFGQAAKLDYRLEGTLFLAGVFRRSVDFARSGSLDVRPQPQGSGHRLVPIGL